jgi:hypothetical protein
LQIDLKIFPSCFSRDFFQTQKQLSISSENLFFIKLVADCAGAYVNEFQEASSIPWGSMSTGYIVGYKHKAGASDSLLNTKITKVSLRFAYSYPQKDLSSIKKSKMIQL